MSEPKPLPEAPKAHQSFVARYPELARAWELMAEEGNQGPLDPSTIRLVKLAIAMGALREGAVHANVRKALALGIAPEAIHQVVALAASTVGMPSAVALHSWVLDILDNQD